MKFPEKLKISSLPELNKPLRIFVKSSSKLFKMKSIDINPPKRYKIN